MGARNITKEFITRLADNGKTAEGWGTSPAWAAFGLLGGVVGSYGNTLTKFWIKVRYGGAWDFKDNWLKGDEDGGVEVAGTKYRYDMPGNFHYGFTGAAAGIGEHVLLIQAGKAQKKSQPEWWCTYGDDPEDQEFIRLGFLLYNQAGLAVTETNLKQVLSQFNVKVCGPKPEEDDPYTSIGMP